MTTKRIILTVTEDFYNKLEARAEKDGFLSVQEAIRFVLKKEVEGLSGANPPTPKPGRPARAKRTEFEEDEEFFFNNQDLGSPCAGSGGIVPELTQMGKYPGGNCPVCNQAVWGRREDGVEGVVLRKHRDGVEVGGAVENYGTVTEVGRYTRDGL